MPNHQINPDDWAAARGVVLQKAGGASLDSAECEREPIHIPGTIQPHGALLAFDASGLKLAACSANAGQFLNQEPAQIIGRALSDLQLPLDLVRFVERCRGQLPTGNPIGLPVRTAQDVALMAWIHERDGMVLVELEPVASPQDVSLELHPIDRRVLELRRIESLEALSQAFVGMVRDMTGFERVLLYSFDDQWNGRTVAETKVEDWGQSFLGLYFPASDIPRQARTLYAENLIRFMPDRDYVPVPILAGAGAPPLDLSGSRLRSLSPIHLEYQRNIGVAGSMSTSILKEDGLWGLLVGHHRRPHQVSPQTAKDLMTLSAAFAIRLSEMEKDATWVKRQQQQTAYGELLETMAGADDFVQALTRKATQLMDLFEAHGVAILNQGVLRCLGKAPGKEAMAALIAWIRERSPTGLYATDNLAAQDGSLAAVAEGATGLLGVLLDQDDAIVWFRPEIVETITWAGNPGKPQDSATDAQRVLPRRSFEAWIEHKRGFTQPWSDWDLKLAANFGRAMENVILRHQHQIRDLSDKLHRIEQLHDEQKITQDALNIALSERSAALRQREMLMREVDHRVKNSLQLISSVLRLQGHRIRDPDARAHFTEASQRVMTVAQVHQRLYQTERVRTVEFSEYLRGLCSDLAQSLAIDPSLVAVEADYADVQTDFVIPLGLIVNELVTNAFKYAYAGRTPGPVQVTFKRKPDGGFALTIADEGVGLPADFDPRESTGLGMKLIAAMTGKLSSALKATANQPRGAAFTIELPDVTQVLDHS